MTTHPGGGSGTGPGGGGGTGPGRDELDAVLAPDLMAEVDLLLHLDGAQALGVEMRAELAAAFEVAGRNTALVASALDLLNAALRRLVAIHTPPHRDDTEAGSNPSDVAAQSGGDGGSRAGGPPAPGARFKLPVTVPPPAFGRTLPPR